MSRLVLERPLVSFDLETTGVDIVNDRIVQIALSKIWQTEKGYSHQDHTWLINPEMPIPKEASEVHGIYDVDVINVPTFATFATEIYSIIKGCDLLGFNSNRFDIPILGEALLKCGIVFPEATTKKIDAQVIFHERESRNLAAAYKKYCNKEIGEDAHNALHDAKPQQPFCLVNLRCMKIFLVLLKDYMKPAKEVTRWLILQGNLFMMRMEMLSIIWVSTKVPEL